MQVLFILMGIVGLTMLFVGIKWSIESIRPKPLVRFPLSERTQEFELKDEGLYAFCILGSRFVGYPSSYTSSLSNMENEEKIKLVQNFLKPKFRVGWKIGIEYQNFKIRKPGKHKLVLGDPNFLRGNSSNLEGMIKKTVTVTKKLFGIIFLVLGMNMSAWGIMLGINPNLFN